MGQIHITFSVRGNKAGMFEDQIDYNSLVNAHRSKPNRAILEKISNAYFKKYPKAELRMSK